MHTPAPAMPRTMDKIRLETKTFVCRVPGIGSIQSIMDPTLLTVVVDPSDAD